MVTRPRARHRGAQGTGFETLDTVERARAARGADAAPTVSAGAALGARALRDACRALEARVRADGDAPLDIAEIRRLEQIAAASHAELRGQLLAA